MPDQAAIPCTRFDDCEGDASHWPNTPCGRRPNPCPSCGFPLPRETDEDFEQTRPCPHGWRSATVADLKQFAAEEGWDTTVEVNGDTVTAAIVPPRPSAPARGGPDA